MLDGNAVAHRLTAGGVSVVLRVPEDAMAADRPSGGNGDPVVGLRAGGMAGDSGRVG